MKVTTKNEIAILLRLRQVWDKTDLILLQTTISLMKIIGINLINQTKTSKAWGKVAHHNGMIKAKNGNHQENYVLMFQKKAMLKVVMLKRKGQPNAQKSIVLV